VSPERIEAIRARHQAVTHPDWQGQTDVGVLLAELDAVTGALRRLVAAEDAYNDADAAMSLLCQADSDATDEEMKAGSDATSEAALGLDAAWKHARELVGGGKA
jgi:hypothetical protein